jgi:hypothetical protein
VEASFTRNEVVEEGHYGITSVMGVYNLFGIKNVLEIIHPQSVNNLMKVIKHYVQDKSESFGDIKVDIHHAIAGGYLLRNNLFEVPEVATTPLKIYGIYKPTVMNRQTGIQFF